MPSVKVEVKWQKETFKDVEIDLEQPPSVFKLQLFSLTGVPPERQKVMGVKGGLLKDDADWAKLGLKPGQKLTMMGTAETLPEAPKQQQTFMEDLPEEEQDTTGLTKYGAGLENMGNTCYMNSTLQCFYAVPELRSSLAAYNPVPASSPNDASHQLAVASKNLFANMTRSAQPVGPLEFIMMLRRKFPQFGERNREGHFMQQDAEECWTNLMYTFKEKVKDPESPDTSAIEKLFGIRLHSNLECKESGEKIQEDNNVYMLKCNITGEVNHLAEGLKLGLNDDREKTSEQLGRLVMFQGESRLATLPPYLTVQMVRFFYKADVQQKAKILRKVGFPLVLDMYDLCTPDFRKQLDGPRLAAKEAEDRRVGLAKKQKLDASAGASSAAANGGEAAAADAAADVQPAAGGDVEMADTAAEGGSGSGAAVEYGGQLTGKYDLIGVLTHKGRSADSGHYVAWVKQDDGQWVQFDDEHMILRKEDEIATLAGGGDWHMAYLLLYKAQRVPRD